MRKILFDWWGGTAEGITVESVAAQSDVNVLAGESFYRLTLPSTVVVTLSDASTPSYNVTWQKGSYSFSTVGTQALTGTLTLPDGVTNPGNVTASINVVSSYSPFNEFDNKVLTISPWRQSTLMQESGTVSVPITNVSATNDPVGFGYSMSPNALTWQTPSSATRPLYSASGGLVFDGTKRIIIPNATNILRGVYASGQDWTISFIIECAAGTDGTAMTIIDSRNNSGAVDGIAIGRDASNRIFLRLSRGGSNIATPNSVATITVASGRTSVIMTRSGTAGTIKVGSAATENFTITNSFGSGNMTNDLVIGSLTGGGTGFSGTLYDLNITNTVISAGNTTSYISFNPGVITTEFPIILQQKYDPADTSNIWADTSRTTPATNGVGVALVDHPTRNNFGDQFLYFISQSTAGQRPLLSTNNPNTKASLSLDGGDDRLVFSRGFQTGGKFTHFEIVRYTGPIDTFGNSHVHFITTTATVYDVITADDYHDNYDPGFGNMVKHDGGGNAISVRVNRLGNLHNQFAFRRDGGVGTLKNGAKETRPGGATTFTGSWAINAIGSDTTDPAEIALSTMYNGLATDTEMDDMIDAINAEFF